MALVVKDRVKETTTTTGTGTVTLGGAVQGYQTFTSVLSNADTTYYAIIDYTNHAFEVGLGTFTSSGTTLARTTILESSNSGSAVDFGSGTKEVFITYPAEKSVYLDASNQLVINGSAVTSNVSELNLLDGKSFVDEDNMSSNSATAIASQQSIKAYVDSQVTAQDLDATTDSGTIDIDLDSETLTIAGGEGIDTSATGTTITITGEEATTSNKGVASFSSTFFSVSSGAVSLVAAQTGLTSVLNTSLVLGRDADNQIKFGTDNQIIFEVDGGDNVIFKASGEIEATSLDISGNADIDGTLEADAITIDGVTLAETISDTVGAMVSSNTETNITVTYDDSDNTLDFVIGTLNQDTTGNAATATALETARTIHGVSFDGTANIDLSEVIEDTVGAMFSSNTETNITATYQDSDGTIDLVIGTLNQDTTGTADNFTVSANNSTDETVYPVFVNGATGSQGAETDTGLTYNPSTGLLTSTGFSGNLTGTLQTAAQANVTSLGTLTTLTVDNVIINGSTIGHTGDTDLMTVASGVLTVAGEVDATSLDISGDADIDGTLEADAITVNGTALSSVISGTTVDLATSITVSANNSADETVYPLFVDGATGTQGAETDTGLTYNPSSGLLTISGELDAGSLDISGNADIDGTLEADAITVDGTALNEYIADTAGAMFSSNTETGVTVTYQDGDNTIDVAVDAAQTTITSLLATDIKIGEDDQTKIDFETADEIHFYAANAEQVYVADGIFGPQTDSDVDLGSSSVRWKDAYVDSVTTTGNVTVGGNLSVTGTTTTVNTVTMEAANAIVFEGATADAYETTLSIVDPTADHTQYLINQGGYIPVLAAATTTAITSTPAELNILDGVTSTTAELNLLDGVTSTTTELNYNDTGQSVGTVVASKTVTVDSNKDVSSFRNVTLTGELDAATLDISGNADIAGDLTLSAGGDGALQFSAASSIKILDNSSASLVVEESDNAYMTFVTTNGSEAVKFDKALDLNAAVQLDSTLTIGANDTGYDVKFFGGTSGAYMLWDEDVDDLILAGAARVVVPDGQLVLGSTAVTSTAAELNIMDGVTATATELNIMDGDTSASSTTVADADRVVLNDNGTMKQVAVTDLSAYFDDEITAMPNLVTTAATTVGALNSGSITSGFGTIDTGSSTITTTGLISGGSLDIDNVLINGTTIGHTDDTDLITVADGLVTIAGEISTTTLDIGGTNVTSTAAELNILDGVTSTAAELNILDGVTSTAAELNILDGVTSTTAELNILDGVTSTATELNIIDGNTSASSTTLADADRVVANDNGTMKQVALTDIKTYLTSAGYASQDDATALAIALG